MADYREQLNLPTECQFPLLGLDWLEWYAPHNCWHPGADLGLPGTSDLGKPVKSIKSGFVEFVQENLLTSSGFGRFVVIHHADNTYTRYGHLKDINVKTGDEIKANQIIGSLGGSGYLETSYSPHLHFEVWTEALALIQVRHVKPYRFYPTGKSKGWVSQYYINPWEWLQKAGELPKEIMDIKKWCIDNKIITENWDEYEKPMSQLRVAYTVKKLYDLITKK